MKKKVIILLFAVFLFPVLMHSQAGYQLTGEQKAWLTKANRHEKTDGFICISKALRKNVVSSMDIYLQKK